MQPLALLLLAFTGLLLAGLVNYLATWLPLATPDHHDTDPIPPDETSPAETSPAETSPADPPPPFSLLDLIRTALTLGQQPTTNRWLRWRGLGIALSMAAGAAGMYLLYGPTLKLLLLGLLFTSLLLITVIDLEHRLIFWSTLLPAALLALLYGGLASGRTDPWGSTLFGGLAYGLIMFALYLGGMLFGRMLGQMRGQPLSDVAFGLGDVYLGAVVGLAVGWPGVVLALLLTVFSGAAVGVVVLVVTRLKDGGDVYMPYGPYITLSAMALLIYAHIVQIAP